MQSHADALRSGLAAALRLVALALAAACAPTPDGSPATSPRPSTAPASSVVEGGGQGAVLALVAGDSVTIKVHGQPELSLATTVAEDGTVTLPLAGSVDVAGLAPGKAAQRIAAAFRQGKFLVDPQVAVTLAQSSVGRVSVLGAVRTPGRFPIESRATVLDVLALAGGISEDGGETVVLLRPDRSGRIARYPIEMKGLSQGRTALPTVILRGGDALFVPAVGHFYIYGEVKAPNMYRLEPGMTVVQAISRGGGTTPRGSATRIELRRRQPNGTYATSSAGPTDEIRPDDVIRVKERLF
jgi:polysaccharide export outer membrane protein